MRSRGDRDEIATRSPQSRVRSHKSLRVAKIPTVSHRCRCAIWSGYIARSVLMHSMLNYHDHKGVQLGEAFLYLTFFILEAVCVCPTRAFF